MIYLFENPNNSASIVYDETTLTDAQKTKGVAVEELPKPKTPEGKQAILKVNKSTSEIWYEYIDAPIDEATEIEQLKASQQEQDDLLMDILLGRV
jgi:uncharacterized protein YaiL (DUF2058 family)